MEKMSNETKVAQFSTTTAKQIRKQYLTIEDDIRSIKRQKVNLEEEVNRLENKLRKLHHDHFKCVKNEVFRLIDEIPQDDQVAVDVSLLKEVLNYFNDYEPHRTLPSYDDLPF